MSAMFKGIVPGVIARRAPPYRVFSPGGVVRAPRTSSQAVGRQREKTPPDPPSAFIWGVVDTPAGIVVGVDAVDDGRAADSAANVHRARTGHGWSNLAPRRRSPASTGQREMSAAGRRSAGGSGFPGTPAGTRAGVGPVDVGRAADRAGSAPGAPTAPKRAIFVVDSILSRFRGRYVRSCAPL